MLKTSLHFLRTVLNLNTEGLATAYDHGWAAKQKRILLPCMLGLRFFGHAHASEFEGQWRATSPKMEITGFASLDIKKSDDGYQVVLLDPGQEPGIPAYTIVAQKIDGKLRGKFHAIFPYFDLDKFLTQGVQMTAVMQPDGNALDVTFVDPVGTRIDLDFYKSTDPRFKKFDVARLDKNGNVVKKYNYRRPKNSKDGFLVSTLKREGIDEKIVERALTQLFTGGPIDRPAFAIMIKNGKLVLEEYFHGTTRDRLWFQYSVTKSITSLLSGIAQDDQKIDLDAPINQYFPDYSSSVWMTSKAGSAGVTPATLLQMGNVLGWGENHDYQDAIYKERGWVDHIFEQPVVTHEPGPYFNYSTMMTNVAGLALERATGVHLSEYTQRELLGPLGENRSFFDSYGAIYGAQSNEEWPGLGGSSVMMRPIAMAKVGQLVLDKGRWKGEQIISEDWIVESTSVASLTFNISTTAYGYSWWITKLKGKSDREVWCVWARGLGGQIIGIIPAYDFVIALGATDFTGPTSRDWITFFEENLVSALDEKEEFKPVVIGAPDLGAITLD